MNSIPPKPRPDIRATAPASTKSPTATAEDVDNFLATISLPRYALDLLILASAYTELTH